MKSTLNTLFSYLFIAAVVILCISAFGSVIIGLRSFFSTISEEEKNLGIKFLVAFVSSGIATPILLYFNRMFEKDTKEYEDIF